MASTVGSLAAPSILTVDEKLASSSSRLHLVLLFHLVPSLALDKNFSCRSCALSIINAMAKELYINKDGSAMKNLQTGVNKLADLVGVTLGLKGRSVVLESKYGSPKIVNDGVTLAKEVELEYPVENIGAKLLRQAASKTNDLVELDYHIYCASPRSIVEGVKKLILFK